MHAVDRIAHGHGVKGVAMVAAPDGQETTAAGIAPRSHVLHGHLHGHLDGHRAGVAQEDTVQVARGKLGQPGAEPRRRFMGDAAEHDVGHLSELGLGGPVEGGVIVAVDRAPP